MGSHAADDTEQLALGGLVQRESDDVEPTTPPEAVVATSDIAPELAGHDHVAADEADEAAADRWTPSFDDADDLDGLLSAQSPLLSRAFRGAGRPD